jgi:RNA polymerase sigma-70 factor (ECF subfamily)
LDFRTHILPHRDRLYRYALGIVANTAEAEDIVQDTMMRAWERRKEWGSIRNIEAWLMQICRNLALDRKKKVMPEDFSESEYKHPSTDLNAALDARESLSFLSQLIRQLPPPQDDIVRLRDIEGLSYHDIADQLSISETQVRVYLHRARQKLREQYQQLQNYGL